MSLTVMNKLEILIIKSHLSETCRVSLGKNEQNNRNTGRAPSDESINRQLDILLNSEFENFDRFLKGIPIFQQNLQTGHFSNLTDEQNYSRLGRLSTLLRLESFSTN